MSVTISGTDGVSKVAATADKQDTLVSGTNIKTVNGSSLLGSGDMLVGAPAGTVIYVAMNTAPSGYIKANGATVSRSTYAALFSAIGTTYGAGDGSTTFGLPDLRGEFIRGWDDGRGVDSGRAFGTAQTDAFKEHGHEIYANSFAGDRQIVAGPVGGDGDKYSFTDSGNDASSSSAVLRAINNGFNETRPRNIALLACIKY